MTKFTQLPQKIDNNVTIVVPKNIEIKYTVNIGWFIVIDTHRVLDENGEYKVWDDVSAPLQWLIDRHLIVTKAYKELEKAVNKVTKAKK